MVLFEELKSHINKVQYKEVIIQEIDYQTFYDETNGKLIIVYNEQIAQDDSLREKINDISKSIREIIKNHVEYNLWNTYLLVLVDKNSFNEKYYYVERDVRNLRKYVIQNENDISRIPFINILENKLDNEELKGHSYSPSEQIQDLYKSLIDKDGDRKKLSNFKISETLKELKFLGEDND
jgi:hypothetical protein